MELNQSRIPSGLPLMHLQSTSMVELGGTSKVPVSVRDRLSPTREGKLQYLYGLILVSVLLSTENVYLKNKS